jgi:hypothetical protein
VITGAKMTRLKPKYKHKNSGKGGLLIKDFTKWLKNNYSGEIHHFYGGRMGKKLDCFIVMANCDLHRQIHFGDIGVQGFIDREGEYNLIQNSMELLQLWVNEEVRHEYQELIDSVLADMDRAVEIAKAFNG